jgi:hypothetical protein
MTKQTFDYARSRGNEHKIGQLNPLARYGIAGEVSFNHHYIMMYVKYVSNYLFH